MGEAPQPAEGRGQDGQPVVAEVQLLEDGQLPDRVRHRAEPIAVEAQLDEALHVPDGIGQRGQAIVRDIEVAQVAQPRHRRGQVGQAVVAQIEEGAEPGESAQRLRQGGQLVVAEVEHLEMREIADPLRHRCDARLRDDQRAQLLQAPGRLGHGRERSGRASPYSAGDLN